MKFPGTVPTAVVILTMCMICALPRAGVTEDVRPAWMKETIMDIEEKLVEKYGGGQRDAIQRGLRQASSLWREEDGGRDVFADFAFTHYAGTKTMREEMFDRFEFMIEKIDGHMNQLTLALKRQADLEIGPLYDFDYIFSGYSPGSHITEDFFKNKLAFIALLNFPVTTLKERLDYGDKWSRREWAEVRLAQIFSKRVPAEVKLAIAEANGASDNYIAGYNIWMHHLIGKDGKRLFPPKMRLLSHWNLRDQIKADYGAGDGALEKQRMIQKVMERIVDQTIPEVVIDNPYVDWDPYSNKVKAASVNDSGGEAPGKVEANGDREPDTRYLMLLNTFKAAKLADPYSPSAPSLIARRFDENREIPEERARKILVDIVSSPMIREVSGIIEKRLGRPLEPFDIWYNGFRSQKGVSQDELDRIVGERYPTAETYMADMENMLLKLGFSPERAAYLSANIVVEPARGSGHAWGPEMRSGKAHLRTRVGPDGMDYKGFNIAVHEMGHNVEQIFTLKDVDHTLLKGVPNTAFTEAFAFTFQARDLMILGVEESISEEQKAMKALDDFWGTYEIAGVSLVDMEIWHWMYENPDASPSELREAVLDIAKDIWNEYYAPVIGVKDVTLLAIYSHIIHSQLYTPDYPIGQMIATQIGRKLESIENIGSELERMAVIGRVTPDVWMRNATGEPVGAEAMLQEARKAIDIVK